MGERLSREQWRRVSAALDRLMDLPRDLREGRLAAACGSDPDLERWVRALLEAADAAGNFLERPHRPDVARRLWKALGLRPPPPPADVPPESEGNAGG